MDDIDKKIIEILQENSRISMSELSLQVNLSRPTVNDRVIRLQENGTIEQFTTRVNPKKLGKDVNYFIEISELKIPFEEMIEVLQNNEYVYEIHCVTGNANFIIKVAMPTTEDMNSFLSELMSYGKIVTSIILYSPMSYRTIKAV